MQVLSCVSKVSSHSPFSPRETHESTCITSKLKRLDQVQRHFVAGKTREDGRRNLRFNEATRVRSRTTARRTVSAEHPTATGVRFSASDPRTRITKQKSESGLPQPR